MLRNLKGAIVFGIAAINTFVWIVPLITFRLLRPLVPIPAFRATMTRWVMAMAENWISVNAVVFNIVNGTRYQLEGLDELSPDKWYLLVVNHQTWVDIIALQTAFNRRVPFLKFFAKQQLAWFPVLGVALWALDMPFMKRYSKDYLAAHPEKKGQDLEITRLACARYHDTPTSVINFVEGTRFSEAKRRRRESPYQYLLPPRSGGIAVTVSAMGEMFDAILDVTIHYPDGVPTFWDAMSGDFPSVRVEVRQMPVDAWLVEGDYVNDREYRRRFHRWLSELWQRKDERLAELAQAARKDESPAVDKGSVSTDGAGPVESGTRQSTTGRQ